ncbi:hypothetical protein B0A52_05663 [Exophiala mesophila]|uniref:Uncharacterized protein n=1 Tax=Exophiala mesophila TaxID=212818 RepID=A0A438N273_EXOME|nr:hypothetical protein B0A52_05663 [Exophiala mesophila]
MGQPLQDVWPVLFGSLSTTFESAKTDAVFGDQDQAVANKELTRAVIDIVQISDSLRLRRKWQLTRAPSDRYAHDEPFWALYFPYPQIEADGTVDHPTSRRRHVRWRLWLERN